jgi:pentatricopeptide repeat protein
VEVGGFCDVVSCNILIHAFCKAKKVTSALELFKEMDYKRIQADSVVRNRTLTLIEREDDTRSWGNFLVYFSHSTTMSCPPRGWGYILIGC